MLARIWTAFLLSLAGVSAIAWLVALMHEKDIRPARELVEFFKKRSKAGRVVVGALFIGFLVFASVKPGDGGGDGGGTNSVQMVIGPGGATGTTGILPVAGEQNGASTSTGGTPVVPVCGQGGLVGNPASAPDEWEDFHGAI